MTLSTGLMIFFIRTYIFPSKYDINDNIKVARIKEFFGDGGLIYSINNIFIINALYPCVKNIIDIPYFIQLLKIYLIK